MGADNIARILVVDDSVGSRRLLSRVLAASGFRTETCGSGRMGLERFRRDRFDLVITDLHMTGMGGLELIQKILELAPSTPIIAVSGCTSARCGLVAARTRGAVAVLSKPIEVDRLVRVVIEALRSGVSTSPAPGDSQVDS